MALKLAMELFRERGRKGRREEERDRGWRTECVGEEGRIIKITDNARGSEQDV